MASSSDWIEAIARPQQETGSPSPQWVAALVQPGAFVEGAPFVARASLEPAEPVSEVAEEGKADPLAEAFEQGKVEGYAAAKAEHQEQDARQRALRVSFRDFDQAAMDSFAQELAETVIGLCSAAFAEYTPDPPELSARCAEAARRLGSAASECALHLHPEDIELLDPTSLEGWRVQADPAMERGGLRFEGPDGSVSDGPEDWRRAIAAAIRG